MLDLNTLRLTEDEGLSAAPRAVYGLKAAEFQQIVDGQLAKSLEGVLNWLREWQSHFPRELSQWTTFEMLIMDVEETLEAASPERAASPA